MEASQQLTDWTHAVIKAESSGNALLLGRYQRRMNLLKLTETSVFLDAGQSLTVHERKHFALCRVYMYTDSVPERVVDGTLLPPTEIKPKMNVSKYILETKT